MVAVREMLGTAMSAVLEERVFAARSSFNAFAEFVLRSEEGLPLRQATIHRIWQVHVRSCWEAGRIPAILAPFGHGKTIQLVIGMVCYELGRNPNLRIKVICQSDSKAMERVLGISAVLLSDRYRLVFPGIRPVDLKRAERQGRIGKWTQHELYLERPGFSIDPSVEAAGVLSAGTGGRSDFNVYDDIVDQRNAIDEPALRPKVAANVDNVWSQRLEPAGFQLYVGTPWHQGDYSHQILRRPAWCVLRQWVSEDQTRIHQEVHNPFPGYPLPVVSPTPANGSGWTTLGSSNVEAVRYDAGARVLLVRFRSGGTYRYDGVAAGVFRSLVGASSPGRFVAQELRDRYDVHRVE